MKESLRLGGEVMAGLLTFGLATSAVWLLVILAAILGSIFRI